MAKKLAVILAVILVVILGIYGYAGGFAKVTVVEEELPSLTVAAIHLSAEELNTDKGTGDSKMSDLRKQLADLGIISDSTAEVISISFTDSTISKVGLSQLLTGFILTDEQAERVRISRPLTAIVQVPATSAYVSRIKQKGVLSLVIGMQKQYKAMMKISEENNIPKNTPTINIINFGTSENAFILPEPAITVKLMELCNKVNSWTTPISPVTPESPTTPSTPVLADSTEA